MIVTTPVQEVKLPTTTVTRLLFPFDENELELWNVGFWRLKKTSVKTLQIELYSVFFDVPIKHVHLIVKEKEHSFISTSLQLQHWTMGQG